MKNKKGSTLIELLAVIVILAIIALIATPIILNMINDAKKSAAKDSAYGYIEAIEYQNSMSQLDSIKYPLITTGDVTTINGQVNVKGTKPTSGTVTITSGRVTGAELCINDYNVSYNGIEATITGSCTGNGGSTELPKGPTSENPDTTETKGLLKIVYLDPTDLTKECTNENSISETETKTGCMKWYVYKDDGTNYTMILDHNTTALVAWNSTGSNTEMKEVETALESDTATWDSSLNPRLISADEIADITGASREDTIKWNSKKSFLYGTDDIETKVSWFYLDGTGTTYSTTDGWMAKTASETSKSKYAWLYDYTNACLTWGCNIEDNKSYVYSGTSTSTISGYWTSTPVVGYSNYTWFVRSYGLLDYNGNILQPNLLGLRPVITISKSIIS